MKGGAPLERQLAGLGTLLQLQKQARHARNQAELAFLIVNDTLRLLRYRQAVLWQGRGRAAAIIAVSGVDHPNPQAPYVQWLRQLFDFLLAEKKETAALGTADLPARLQQGWEEWSAPHGLWCPFAGEGHDPAGLWLIRDEPWQQAEQALLAQLIDAYGHAWQALSGKISRKNSWTSTLRGRPFSFLLGAAALAALALPIDLTVLAPAQIVPMEPLVVSAPVRGVIDRFHIFPNQEVETGQLLFTFEDTEVRNRHQLARKALAVAEAEYRQATQKSLFSRGSDIDAELLRAWVEAKKAEVEYAAGELARVEVRAARPGLALFADVNEWQGRPVVTGEKILLLADPARRELEIRVPLDNAVNLEPGARVRLFLNVAPALDIRAVIRQTSYQARETAGGEAAYVVRASLERDLPQLRIGLTGTAKIYGERHRLYYFLFRRPWAAVRERLGV